VPFTGPGLWGQIHGILALEPDLQTIRGVRFYRHEETPGLGGEISAAWFLEQFPGRKLVGEDGTPGFRIPKPGGAKGAPNAVDGISGATMTCDRVQDMLDGLAKQLAEDSQS
jgi:Na+-transporting NADH:ubiquinone oxidoreductase subunit C